MTAPTRTLRLNMPQWQGGNDPAYHFGARLLVFLAPDTEGPEESVAVPPPRPGEVLPVEDGLIARRAVLAQARAARAAIARHDPDRIVTLGGDCLVDLAPIAWLNERYGGRLGVLWIDAHPDVMTPEGTPHAHAHVLGLLLGRGDPELRAEVTVPVEPQRVMYAGLDAWSPAEAEVIDGLGIARAGSAALAASSAPVTDWIRAQGIAHVAIHFDLDVLDPARFGPLIFNRPERTCDYLAGVPRGRMHPEQVVRLLTDVAGVCDIVGIAIAEHMPWEAMATRDLLARLPLLSG